MVDGHEDQTDSAQQIAGLHSQLDAMKVRLHSMFQTASDLISSGDVDEVLARIADRAAIEVRAPRHMLAVRMTADGPLHCHHKGFDDAEVAEHAERLLTEAVEDLPGSWLVVPVRSTRRDYGRLLATSPRGAASSSSSASCSRSTPGMPPARWTAPPLCSRPSAATISQALCWSWPGRWPRPRGTSAEIARRLADAVPTVVDCDRVAVYLWDDERNELVRSAHSPLEATAGPVRL